MSDIPADVIGEIISRLPVEPLLRLRCVSKSWLSIIDSPAFIKLHISRAKNHRNVLLKYRHSSSIPLESLDHATVFDSPTNCRVRSIPSDSLNLATDFDSPTGTSDYSIVVGSCNGLLCLLHMIGYKGVSDYLVLRNPSTRKSKMLWVKSSFPGRFFPCISYGFGYDSLSDEYKLVRMGQLRGKGNDSFESDVRVYGLNSNSWRNIQECPFYLLHRRVDGGVFVNGALHWVVSLKPPESGSETLAGLIAAFDLGAEEYRLVLGPEFSERVDRMDLKELGGGLCLVCSYYKVCVDVWVMDEYGVKESWRKLFSFHLDWIGRRYSAVRPLAYSKCGGKVLADLDGKCLFWYDLSKKTIKYLSIRTREFHADALICTESLVPLRE